MIIVFGSLNVDMFMEVDHLPRPGETVLTPSYELAPGGKGANQAVAAARAGGTSVAMVGCVGDDDWAERATALMGPVGIDLTHIARRDLPTACAAIWVDKRGENVITVASGANGQISAGQLPDALLGPKTMLLLQMEVPAEENWALLARAHEHGTKTMLNAAPAGEVPTACLEQLDILVVNEIETDMIATQQSLHGGDPMTVARTLAQRFDLTVVVTLGSKGALAATPNEVWTVEALPIDPVDTTGAGDAFAGTMAAALDQGLGLADALRRGAVGAGLACLSLGCQPAYANSKKIDHHMDDIAPAQRLG